MGIDIIYKRWMENLNETNSSFQESSVYSVKIKFYEEKDELKNDDHALPKHVYAPLPLLHAAILLLSNYKEDEDDDEPMDHTQYKEPHNRAVMGLAKYLIVAKRKEPDDPTVVTGLAGATASDNKRAICIDHVSKEDYINSIFNCTINS